MSVRIRLKKRFNLDGYDVIVTSNGQLKGRLLDVIGFYNVNGLDKFLRIDLCKLNYWLQTGAKCSERVLKITKLGSYGVRKD